MPMQELEPEEQGRLMRERGHNCGILQYIICLPLLMQLCLCTIAHTTLIHKNYLQSIGNIDKCSMSEAHDKSVPGDWLG